MADAAGYRFQQPGAAPFYYQQQQAQNHHQRHIARNGSPVNSSRSAYANDTPSPTRSPVSQASSHNPYAMYNQGHPQGQHVMMNGGAHQRYMQMNLGHKYQHQNHQPQQHHTQQNHHHQQNHASGHGGIGQQHTFSSGTMSSVTPHFTPNNLHNGTSTTNQVSLSDSYPPHYQHQMQLLTESRSAHGAPHHHCKRDGVISRLNKVADQTATEERQDDGREERNRASTIEDTRRQDWDALDCSGQGMKSLSPALFVHYMFLKRLYLDHNRLSNLDPMIGQLRCLDHLDVSENMIIGLPEEIGMLVNLKTLLAFDNEIHDLPNEIGHLFKLETLGIEGNPIDEGIKDHLMQNGTKSLVTHMRENTPAGPPPNDRDWLEFDNSPVAETLSVLSHNILCDKYATSSQYGYTPSKALAWVYRRDLILREIDTQDADIVCLQEVDRQCFDDFRARLALQDYRGVFWPKSRAKTMQEKEAKVVDGCATFYKAAKYVFLDKQLIEFANTAINRPDMKGEHDTFNRVMPRDDIGVATFLENRATGSRLMVVNTHVFWDPTFTDVKLIQVAILMEQITKQAEKWANWPPCTEKTAFRHTGVDDAADPKPTDDAPPELGPSLEYSSGPQIPLIICGDFNSAAGSGVYDLITKGSLPGTHPDLASRGYGNFTRDGMAHPFKLRSAYNGTDQISFTNYTSNFTDVIDYIWYSHNALQLRGVLGSVDEEYLRKVPGFPNWHFPSDHLALKAEFSVKPQKALKVAEGDSGAQRDWERRN